MEGPCQDPLVLGDEIGSTIDQAVASLFRVEVVAGG